MATFRVLNVLFICSVWTFLPEAIIHAQNDRSIRVTSSDNEGPGSLRTAIQNAIPGDEIRFDPLVFKSDHPATIYLKSPLPALSTGDVTITGEDAGVIIDGRYLGNEPQRALLDDISLTIDDGPNLLQNGGFSESRKLNHWHFWQIEDADNFHWNGLEGVTDPGVFEWNGTNRQKSFALMYIPMDIVRNSSGIGTTYPDTSHDSFLNVDGGDEVELRFWYRFGNISMSMIVDTLADGWVFHYRGLPYTDFWDKAVLRAQLPETTQSVAIQIIINPSSSYNGLEIRSDHNTVQGLSIVNMPGNAILIENGSYNLIGGSRDTYGGSCSGVCNLLAGNMQNGIAIEGGEHNTIQGNFLGVEQNGEAAFANKNANISIHASSNNLIGGKISMNEGNVISGSGVGINISQEEDSGEASHNIIQGNLIGTDPSGTKKVRNEIGIGLIGSGQNMIGGTDPDQRNVISGNDIGVSIARKSNQNRLTGNYIGLDLSGTLPLGNNLYGIQISEGSKWNQIGGPDEGSGNFIAGNGKTGINIFHQSTSENLITGNAIGIGSDKVSAIPNLENGIQVEYAQNNKIGPGNMIANNKENGINIFVEEGSNTNLITQNSIKENGASAIRINTISAIDIPMASGVSVSSRTVSGHAFPASLIEVYQDPQDEASTYMGSTTTDEQGKFHFVTQAGTTIDGNITVLVSSAEKGTGSLSDPAILPHTYLKEMPGFSSPEQISIEPQVILLNSGVAVIAMILFGIMATWFNETLENFSPEITRGIHVFIKKNRVFNVLGMIRERKNRKLRMLLHWLIILGITAIIQTFLDDQIQFDRFWLGQIGTLMISGVFITGIQIVTEVILRRLSADKPDVKETEVSRAGLLIALISVGFSRLIHFSPGVVLGTVDGLYCTPPLKDRRQNAQRALTAKGIVLSITFLGWLASPTLTHTPGLQALFITMFVIGIQYAFFELLPLKALDGYAIRAWNQWAWRAAFLVSTFGFIYIILNPDLGDLSAFRENQLHTIGIIAGFLGMLVISMKFLIKRLENPPTGSIGDHIENAT